MKQPRNLLPTAQLITASGIGLVLATFMSTAMAEPLVYEGKTGPGVGKHIVFLAGDHEYRSEETLPALARILAVHHGFRCTVLFTVHPSTGEIDPAANHMPGTKALETADLAVVFLRFKDLPDDQMQPIADYLDRAGPVVGLRTSTHAFKIPEGKTFSRFDFEYKGEEYPLGFGRQVLGETWAGHYGKNHVMSTRLDIVDAAKSHPIMKGVTRPWAQAGGYWTEPMEDSEVLALAQPLEAMTSNAEPAEDKEPCPGVWTRHYTGNGGKKGRVFTTTYGASEDLVDLDFRRMMVNACFWAARMEEDIAADLNVDFVGAYQPSMFRFSGHRRHVLPSELANLNSPIMSTTKPIKIEPRKKRK
ncbi:MAG: ThuA domain-containing protein [Planctomycetota bacterium]